MNQLRVLFRRPLRPERRVTGSCLEDPSNRHPCLRCPWYPSCQTLKWRDQDVRARQIMRYAWCVSLAGLLSLLLIAR